MNEDLPRVDTIRFTSEYVSGEVFLSETCETATWRKPREALIAHFNWHDGRSKVVVWEHNSHVGDARATSMGDSGEWNVGQLSRERFGEEAFLVGFTTYSGTVTAARDWGHETRAVEPLDRTAGWESAEVPETFPSGV